MLPVATNEQIEIARKAYFNATWAHYEGMLSEKAKLAEKVETARLALLRLDPGHFVKRERETFEEALRERSLTPEEADRRIAEYVPSERAQELDRV